MKNGHQKQKNGHKVDIKRTKTDKVDKNIPRSNKMLRFKRKLTKKKVDYIIKLRE